ncbi:hypothetical protein BCV70DRAFT_56976 [Testicularia cyperi]|uniref:Uncharacterized protein n=1 Tax=Testicularia cyperi TaxID=1882483 RepID=A0A317XUR2_9BASI|nr:hypothetical protein BCV70DRAFT_56976 [Testicularia cyperi]
MGRVGALLPRLWRKAHALLAFTVWSPAACLATPILYGQFGIACCFCFFYDRAHRRQLDNERKLHLPPPVPSPTFARPPLSSSIIPLLQTRTLAFPCSSSCTIVIGTNDFAFVCQRLNRASSFSATLSSPPLSFGQQSLASAPAQSSTQ